MVTDNILKPHVSDYYPQFKKPYIKEDDDNSKQTDTDGDLCEPVRDVLDEESKLD